MPIRDVRWERSRPRTAALPRGAGRARRPDLLEPRVARAMATRQRYGFCGNPVCSPSSWLVRRCCVAACRSFRSRWIPLRPTCMSAVPRSTGAPCSARKLQGLLVGAHRLVETTLRIRMSARAMAQPMRIRDVPGLEKARHASGIRLMCGLEISARPPCETKQRGSAATAEMVVFRGEVESPPRMLHGQASLPISSAWPARWTAIAPGRRRNCSSSTTTIPGEPTSGRSGA